ncbi:MAG: hypothetical protein LN413_00100 [Candidatus Thermoplasmatota archaeon]|nr:hypothetical protein [Candidatus Thermoplasmatota archaeon]
MSKDRKDVDVIDTRNHNFIALRPLPVLVKLHGEDRWRWNPSRARVRSWLWPKGKVGVVARQVHLDCPWPAKSRAHIRHHCLTCPWTIRDIDGWWYWVHSSAELKSARLTRSRDPR